MKIIAGRLRGRRLPTPDVPGVRPTSGRIKQSLFDIVAGLVPGSRWLDLFAGTGSVGLEALSRGAESVFFVDFNRRCVELMKKNLDRAGLSGKARVHYGNALSDLSWVPYRAGVERFDFVFLGPPYRDEGNKPLAYTNVVLQNVVRAGLLASQGLIVSQRHVKEPVAAAEGLELARRVKYGDSFLDFYRIPGQAAPGM